MKSFVKDAHGAAAFKIGDLVESKTRGEHMVVLVISNQINNTFSGVCLVPDSQTYWTDIGLSSSLLSKHWKHCPSKMVIEFNR